METRHPYLPSKLGAPKKGVRRINPEAGTLRFVGQTSVIEGGEAIVTEQPSGGWATAFRIEQERERRRARQRQLEGEFLRAFEAALKRV